MNVEIWKKVLKKDHAVPLSERFGVALVWVLLFFLIGFVLGAQWYIVLFVCLVFPGLPIVTGLMIDYSDEKRNLEKGLD